METNKKNIDGQSTIEFLSTLSFVLAIIFFYVKMALNITNGYLMQYAVFMASRAYLVYDGGQADAEPIAKERAKQVFNEIKKWAVGIESGGDLSFNSPDDSTRKIFVGAWSQFKQKFSYSALIGGGDMLNYISESFLGREPTAAECTMRVCEMLDEAGIKSCEMGVTVVDNGC